VIPLPDRCVLLSFLDRLRRPRRRPGALRATIDPPIRCANLTERQSCACTAACSPRILPDLHVLLDPCVTASERIAIIHDSLLAVPSWG
jgi:hypothetical protein